MEEHTRETSETPAATTSAVGAADADHHDVRSKGIQDEGIVTSDIFGIMLATVLSIACSVFVLYFVFFVTTRDRAREVAADVPAERYVEQRELRAEAQDAYAHYAVSPDAEGRYRIPINAAMEIVERNSTGGIAAPASRTDFNLARLNLHAAPATVNNISGGISAGVASVVTDTTVGTGPEEVPEPSEESAEAFEEVH